MIGDANLSARAAPQCAAGQFSGRRCPLGPVPESLFCAFHQPGSRSAEVEGEAAGRIAADGPEAAKRAALGRASLSVGRLAVPVTDNHQRLRVLMKLDERAADGIAHLTAWEAKFVEDMVERAARERRAGRELALSDGQADVVDRLEERYLA